MRYSGILLGLAPINVIKNIGHIQHCFKVLSTIIDFAIWSKTYDTWPKKNPVSHKQFDVENSMDTYWSKKLYVFAL